MLDPFHALEHVAAAAKGLYGEGAAEAADWAARTRRSLLGDGWPGLCDVVGATLAAGVSAAGQAAVDDLVSYFAKHTDRLGYYGVLLPTGRSSGEAVAIFSSRPSMVSPPAKLKATRPVLLLVSGS